MVHSGRVGRVGNLYGRSQISCERKNTFILFKNFFQRGRRRGIRISRGITEKRHPVNNFSFDDINLSLEIDVNLRTLTSLVHHSKLQVPGSLVPIAQSVSRSCN